MIASGKYRISLRRLLWPLVFCGVFAAAQFFPALDRQNTLMGFPKLGAPLMPSDPDIWIYLAQTRQWIVDGLGLAGRPAGWFFDHVVRHTNAPFGGLVIHWTRPMQTLLALFYFLTPTTLSVNMRMLLAANWLPPFLCLAAAGFTVGAARRYFRHGCVVLLALVLMLLNPETPKNFSAGNADHHGLLSMLWCGVLYFLLDGGLSTVGATALGAVLGVMAWIGVEALVLIGLVFGLLGLDALARPERIRLLLAAALGTAIVTTIALFVEMPAAAILQKPVYDTLSAVYVTLFWLVACGALILEVLFTCRFQALPALALRGRILASGGAGAAILLALYGLYPKVFFGPLVDADPFVNSDFHPNINEMKPLFQVPAEIMIPELAWPVFACLLLLACLARREMREVKRRQLLMLVALLLATTGCMLAENRWAYYVQPVAVVALAALLPGFGATALPARFRRLPALPRHWRPWRWVGFAYLLLLFVIHIYPDRVGRLYHMQQNGTGFCMAQIRQVVQTRQLQPLLGDRDLVLFIPENLGGDTLFFTPYRIIATNLHREGPELHDMRRIETAETETAAKNLLDRRKTEALLYCPTRLQPSSWLRRTGEQGKYPGWLTPVAGLRFVDELPGPRPVLLKVNE